MNKFDVTVVEIFNHLLTKHPELNEIYRMLVPTGAADDQVAGIEAALGQRFTIHHKKNQTDLLASLCDQYGSDKGELSSDGHPYPWPSHTYTDYYSRLFSHCRAGVKTVFECGLGTNNPDMVGSMGVNGKPGASLRVWRDYFPNAMVYGADIDKDILFEEKRIKTHYINQLDPGAICAFWDWAGVSEFDFMVDDGLHVFEAGVSLFENSINKLSANGIYVIEDVSLRDMKKYQEYFNRTNYLVDYINMYRPNLPLGDNNLVVIRKTE